MHTLNISLRTEDDLRPLTAFQTDKPLEVVINGVTWEFDLHRIACKSDVDEYHGAGLSVARVIRIKSGSSYEIDGYISNKTEKELRKAKEEVRIKQQEFKEAQRKLSELMDNKI